MDTIEEVKMAIDEAMRRECKEKECLIHEALRANPGVAPTDIVLHTQQTLEGFKFWVEVKTKV